MKTQGLKEVNLLPGRWRLRHKVKPISQNKGNFLCIALDSYLSVVATALRLNKFLTFSGTRNTTPQQRKC